MKKSFYSLDVNGVKTFYKRKFQAKREMRKALKRGCKQVMLLNSFGTKFGVMSEILYKF